MRKLVLVFVMGLFMSAGAWAQDLQKGWDALGNKDYVAALQELRPLAEEGHVGAQLTLAVMYEKGTGVPQNYQEAFKWYKLSAERGNRSAQNSLGFLYALGNGVPQDFVRAHMWYNLAASAGYENAVESRNNIAKDMTPTQIEKAQQLASECVAKNYKGC